MRQMKILTTENSFWTEFQTYAIKLDELYIKRNKIK